MALTVSLSVIHALRKTLEAISVDINDVVETRMQIKAQAPYCSLRVSDTFISTSFISSGL
jgi:hypothetical protein